MVSYEDVAHPAKLPPGRSYIDGLRESVKFAQRQLADGASASLGEEVYCHGHCSRLDFEV